MLNKLREIVKDFLKESENKKIEVISHYDTDGITSAAIMAKALQRLDKNFSVKIIKQLEKQTISSLGKDRIIVFLDLASGSIDHLNKLKCPVYVLDHHEIDKKQKINSNIKIINPYLFDEESLCGAALTYLFVKEINEKNKNLARLAVIGMVGDMQDQNIGKIGSTVVKDAEMKIKKGLLLYPATRPLNKTLEFSSSMYIPGVTGSSSGAAALLKDAGIESEKGRYKSLIELDDDEMSRLVTAIVLKRTKRDTEKFIGNIYLIKLFNRLEDAREMSAMINACSRLDHSEVALAFCMGSRESRKKAERIYADYKQHIISGLNYVSNLEKIQGKDYIIINAKDNIKDTVIGTIASILSMSSVYREGTAIITMAWNNDKIKVSGRVAGRQGRNIREILDAVVENVGGESGGHPLAAGCLISREKESEFIELLKKRLEVELVKI
jgi:RecJ-like exonuclease